MPEGTITEIQVNPYSIITFIGYLMLVIGIGIYAAKFSSSGVKAYFVGGRQMNRFVVALSAVVSGRSSWLLLGVTGMAYKMGPCAVWAVVGYIIVELFLFVFYAKRLRRFSEVYDCITLPDFFASRFEDKNGRLRSAMAVIILIFMISYVGAQFVGGGKAFAASFNIDQTTGIIITAAIVLLYTMVGGFLAVSLTDMFQAFFMILALLILPIIAILDKGGLSIVLQQLEVLDPAFIDPFAISIGASVWALPGIRISLPVTCPLTIRSNCVILRLSVQYGMWLWLGARYLSDWRAGFIFLM
jgi:SSS family solute:Na+ symporter